MSPHREGCPGWEFIPWLRQRPKEQNPAPSQPAAAFPDPQLSLARELSEASGLCCHPLAAEVTQPLWVWSCLGSGWNGGFFHFSSVDLRVFLRLQVKASPSCCAAALWAVEGHRSFSLLSALSICWWREEIPLCLGNELQGRGLPGVCSNLLGRMSSPCFGGWSAGSCGSCCSPAEENTHRCSCGTH